MVWIVFDPGATSMKNFKERSSFHRQSTSPLWASGWSHNCCISEYITHLLREHFHRGKSFNRKRRFHSDTFSIFLSKPFLDLIKQFPEILSRISKSSEYQLLTISLKVIRFFADVNFGLIGQLNCKMSTTVSLHDRTLKFSHIIFLLPSYHISYIHILYKCLHMVMYC